LKEHASLGDGAGGEYSHFRQDRDILSGALHHYGSPIPRILHSALRFLLVSGDP
jgi:hypothetical protein